MAHSYVAFFTQYDCLSIRILQKNLDNQKIKAMNVMPIAQGKAKQTPGY
jgi:hypothetical protein